MATHLAADSGLETSDRADDLGDPVLDFHEAGNPVSFNLAGLGSSLCNFDFPVRKRGSLNIYRLPQAG